MLVKLIENKWNEETEKVLKDARKISDDKPIVAILSDKVFTYIDPDTDDIQEIVSRCKEKMNAAISGAPDFSYLSLPEDECGLVSLNDIILTHLTKEEAKWGENVPREAMIDLIIYRQMAIEACEKGEIIAVYIPDKE
jgi:hypothetical protein